MAESSGTLGKCSIVDGRLKLKADDDGVANDDVVDDVGSAARLDVRRGRMTGECVGTVLWEIDSSAFVGLRADAEGKLPLPTPVTDVLEADADVNEKAANVSACNVCKFKADC